MGDACVVEFHGDSFAFQGVSNQELLFLRPRHSSVVRVLSFMRPSSSSLLKRIRLLSNVLRGKWVV
jgi:hypothetical protein